MSGARYWLLQCILSYVLCWRSVGVLYSILCLAALPDHAESRARCGSELVAHLEFVCGDRGFYRGKVPCCHLLCCYLPFNVPLFRWYAPSFCQRNTTWSLNSTADTSVTTQCSEENVYWDISYRQIAINLKGEKSIPCWDFSSMTRHTIHKPSHLITFTLIPPRLLSQPDIMLLSHPTRWQSANKNILPTLER